MLVHIRWSALWLYWYMMLWLLLVLFLWLFGYMILVFDRCHCVLYCFNCYWVLCVTICCCMGLAAVICCCFFETCCMLLSSVAFVRAVWCVLSVVIYVVVCYKCCCSRKLCIYCAIYIYIYMCVCVCVCILLAQHAVDLSLRAVRSRIHLLLHQL